MELFTINFNWAKLVLCVKSVLSFVVLLILFAKELLCIFLIILLDNLKFAQNQNIVSLSVFWPFGGGGRHLTDEFVKVGTNISLEILLLFLLTLSKSGLTSHLKYYSYSFVKIVISIWDSLYLMFDGKRAYSVLDLLEEFCEMFH